jgi:uncharacterized protein (TIGR02246 family)
MTPSIRRSTIIRLVQLWAALAVVLLAAACNSAPPPTPDTRAADEAAVRKADADWVKAAQTKKVDEWLAFYSDDAVALPGNDKTAVGKDAIHKPIAEMMALPELSISWTPTKVEVARSGDLAYLYGTYQMSFKGPDGKVVADNGKMVEIWKKQADGNWKCIVDTWNSDLPAAPPPSPAT